jgi:D-glycero-D-manno-heptose 1,7-bisphosphate phosphatase
MANKAVFLDRDGTLIEDPGYLADPAAVRLLPGVDLAIKSLRQANFKIVVVTNQSGVARGLLTEETLEKIHAEMRRKLAEKGAMLDAVYYCPYHPEGTVLDLDLSSSWMIGDSDRDIAAGQAAGCRTVRIKTRAGDGVSPAPGEEAYENLQADVTVRNLVDAARVILRTNAPAETAMVDDPAEPTEEDEPNMEPEPAETIEAENEDEAQTGDTDAQDAPTPAKPAALETDSEVRKEILRHVRQIVRQADTQEFSLLNLLGGLAQALVLLCLLMVFWKMLGKQDIPQATLWAVMGVIFQTMSLTFFIISRSRRS